MAKRLKSSIQIAESFEAFLSLVNETRKTWDFKDDDIGGPWFRGQQRKNWKLQPTVLRIGCTSLEQEDEIREEFAIRAPALSRHENLPTNDWDMYFLMQHYGAPTRLLDWTESPLIALYFAVRDNPGFYDSAVWMLDPYQLNYRVIKRDEVIAPSAVGANPNDTKRISKWLPERWSKNPIPELPVAIFPTHIARRISSQRSCFTVHGHLYDGLSRFSRGTDSCLKQIIIPGFAVPAIRADLQKFGIDDTTIFPDLAGLGRALSTSHEILKRSTPHKGVYVRIKPSKLHKNSVGVFAVKQIPSNTRLFAEENEEIRWMTKNSVPRTGPFRKLYDDFSIIKDGRYGCPVSFNRLTPAWFLNDSKTPNVRCDDNYDFYTLRKIKAGEEITVDYETFSESP